MNLWRALGWCGWCLCSASSCTTADGSNRSTPQSVQPATAPKEHADEHAGLPKNVRLSPAVVTDAKIKTAKAVREALHLTVALPGEIVADPDKSARISSPVAGRIERVSFREGSAVKAGDALAVVRVPELGKIRASYAATLERAKAARANAERTQALAAQRLGAEQASLDARATADALDEEAHALEEQLSAIGASSRGPAGFELVLRAPIAGIVIARDAVVGQPVSSDQLLGSLADLSEVWFLGRAFEKDLGRLQAGTKAEVQLNAYPDDHFAGSVEYIGRQVDPVARTVTARIRLRNHEDRLRIGLFGTAYVATEEHEKHDPMIVVPRSALTEIAGKQAVFVQHDAENYELHEVATGDAALGKVEIISGLREGEEVVIDGVFTLKSLVLKSAIEGE